MRDVGAVAVALLAGALLAPAAEVPAVDRLQREFLIRRWHLEDGLPDVSVVAITQTADGYLWLATRVGIARFDGLRFVTFDGANTPELPDNEAHHLVADDVGNLWIGLASQVVVHQTNGKWGRVLPAGGPPAPHTAPVAAGDGTVWVQDGGQTWWRCRPDGPANMLPGPPIRGQALAVSANGDVWWLNHDRLHRHRRSDGQRAEFPLPTGWPQRAAIGAFAHGPDDSLWLALGSIHDACGGLARVEESSPLALSSFPLDADAHEISLASDRDGRLWLSVLPRLAQVWWRPSTPPEQLRLPGLEADDLPVSLFADREGSFWLGTQRSGLYRLHPRTSPPRRWESALSHDNVRAVLCLSDGQLVAGTDRGLVLVPAPSPAGLPGIPPVETEPNPQISRELAGVSIRALAEDDAHHLWVGTTEGLFVRGTNRYEAVSLPVIEGSGDGDRRASLKLRALRWTRHGDLWAVAPRMVSVRAAGAATFRAVLVLPRDSLAASITEDSTGRVWLATGDRGLVVFTQPAADRSPGELPEWWRSLPEDLCHADPGDTARCYLSPSAWVSHANGLSSDRTTDIWPDRAGGLWVACDDGLTYLPPNAQFTLPWPGAFQFTTAQGLPSHHLNSLIEDERGWLWCGTDTGIFGVAHGDLLAVAAGRTNRVSAVPCGEDEGLAHTETNGQISRPGSAHAADGQLWFASTHGLVPISPRRARHNDTVPQVAIEEVIADGQLLATTTPGEPRGGPTTCRPLPQHPHVPAPISAKAALALPPGRARAIEFRFTGLSFLDPGRLVFRYRLVGYEEAWHEAGIRRMAYYTNLDPGAYRFQVLVASHHGSWSTVPAEFAFRLEPHFWQTTSFHLAAAAGMVSALLGAVTWRVRQVRRHEALGRQNAILQERASIARDIHDDLGPRLTQLALLTEVADPAAPDASGQPRTWPAPDDSSRRRLALLARDLANTLDGTLWTVEPAGDTLPSFAEYLVDFTADFLRPAGLRLRLDVASALPAHVLARATKRHLFLFMKETLNNIVKHAGAKTVSLHLSPTENGFVLAIADDGRGLPLDEHRTLRPPALNAGSGSRGLGLGSLQARAEALGSTLRISSTPGRGTTVSVDVPCPHRTS